MRVRLGTLILTLGLVLLALGRTGSAQPQASGKVWRIGMLTTAAPPFPAHNVFLRALRERGGYVEGQNLTVVYRYAEGRVDRLPTLAAELVGANVDVIVTANFAEALAVKKATVSIPIVSATTDDPVAAGLAVSLARPGGNVTGVVLLAAETAGKRLQVLKEMLPKVSRIGMLVARGSDAQVEETQVAARHLGIHLVRLDVGTADELDQAFERAKKERVGAIITIASPLLGSLLQRVIGLAARHRLPAMYPFRVGVLTTQGAQGQLDAMQLAARRLDVHLVRLDVRPADEIDRAKAGVIAFTQALAQELRGTGVTANCVLPSTMDTPANRGAMPDADRRGWAPVESVAEAIAFLAGDEAGHVTGALVSI